MQVGTTKGQGLYNKPSVAVHPGALAAGTLAQYNTISVFLKIVSSNKHLPIYTLINVLGLIGTSFVRTDPYSPTSRPACSATSLFQHLVQKLISCWFNSCSIFIIQVRDFSPFICLFIGRIFSCVMQLVKETDTITLQNTPKYNAVRCFYCALQSSEVSMTANNTVS